MNEIKSIPHGVLKQITETAKAIDPRWRHIYIGNMISHYCYQQSQQTEIKQLKKEDGRKKTDKDISVKDFEDNTLLIDFFAPYELWEQ